mmetsp:Transcript_20455/g.38898  ORF Transcript_20455/g.38898 Transcript_20455/m.38898 type:complete len:337 (+) Transcript_20455:718-1728(+)
MQPSLPGDARQLAPELPPGPGDAGVQHSVGQGGAFAQRRLPASGPGARPHGSPPENCVRQHRVAHSARVSPPVPRSEHGGGFQERRGRPHLVHVLHLHLHPHRSSHGGEAGAPGPAGGPQRDQAPQARGARFAEGRQAPRARDVPPIHDGQVEPSAHLPAESDDGDRHRHVHGQRQQRQSRFLEASCSRRAPRAPRPRAGRTAPPPLRTQPFASTAPRRRRQRGRRGRRGSRKRGKRRRGREGVHEETAPGLVNTTEAASSSPRPSSRIPLAEGAAHGPDAFPRRAAGAQRGEHARAPGPGGHARGGWGVRAPHPRGGRPALRAHGLGRRGASQTR